MKIKFYKSLIIPALCLAFNGVEAQTLTVASVKEAGFGTPSTNSVVVTSDGTIYAIDQSSISGSPRITRTFSTGQTQTTFLTIGAGATGLTLSPDGTTLYYATTDGVINKVDIATGIRTDLLTGQGNDVSDIVLDENGDLIFDKRFNGDIHKISKNGGTRTTLIDGTRAGAATNGGDGALHTVANTFQTRDISGFAYDKARKILYVADRSSSRIRKIDLNPASPTFNLISTYAGTGTAGDGAGGSAANATAIGNGGTGNSSLLGMHVDGNGNLFFTDRQYGKIKRVDFATGILTVVAGGGATALSPSASASPTSFNLGTGDIADVYIANGAYYIANGFNGNTVLKVIDSTLPVTITGFAAKAVNNAIVVQWKTQEEVDFSRFELLRSTDGTNFSVVDVQAAKGNGSSYSYSDANVALGTTYYYKLNSIDQNGTSVLSQPTVASLGGASDDIVVFSNTQNNAININTASAEKLSVKLVNLTGQLIYKGDFSGNQSIATSSYAKGIYVVTITNASGKVIKVQKVVI